MQLSRYTVADQLVEILYQVGVRHIYGIPGDAINDLVDTLRRDGRIRFIQVRHEEAGALAASAEAKLTGRLAVCVGSAGAGAIHLLNGLYDAKLDRAPVLAITGQVVRSQLGNPPHQDIDIGKLFDDVSLYNAVVSTKAQLNSILIHACRTAVYQRGVSHVILPDTISSAYLDPDSVDTPALTQSSTMTPDDEAIRLACDLIAQSEKVLILAGAGALSAKEQTLALSKKLKAPIVRTLRAKELLPDDHPNSLGGLGRMGTKAALEAVKECDLLIMLGTDFPYDDFYPAHAQSIQINRDILHIGRRYRADVELHGEVNMTLEKLLRNVRERKYQAFMEKCRLSMDKWREQERTKEKPLVSHPKPQCVAHLIGKLADKDAIFVCDTGTVTAWAACHLKVTAEQRFTLSGNLATMGFGLPAAIGSQLSYPDRQVIALVGDGGFAMLMQDFLTVVKYRLPVTIVIFNNGRLDMVKQEQESRGYPPCQTALNNPDFAEFARLCGGCGWTVEDGRDLEEALKAAYASNHPSIVDVKIDVTETLVPPKIDVADAVNFAIAKMRELTS